MDGYEREQITVTYWIGLLGVIPTYIVDYSL